jgi:penicillin G amidase
MKYILFLLSFSLTLGLAISLSIPFGTAPPIGYLLDPNHGFWQNCLSEDALSDEEINITGLIEPVSVVYDEQLIPHIFAQNEEDLYRVQGYVTAQHRLWQMEFQTRAAAGRLSEIVGEVALDLDRMTRRKGLAFGAERTLAYLQKEAPDTFRLMEAYASGVNQYIEQLNTARLPLEYKLLNYRPEPWSPYKTILLLKYMSDMLVGDRDLEYTNMRKILGEELMDKLFPDFPKENDPIIEATKTWEFEPLPVNVPDSIAYPDDNIVLEPLPQPEPGIGSNNWAVSGAKTKSGNPILANDPHLSLNLPSLWYALQLSTPEHTVKGASLPGALGVISGFNTDIAWGVTNATRDTRDWYQITFKDDSRETYQYDGDWLPTTKRLEQIQLKGGEVFVDTVVYTHFGPIVYDRSFRSDRQHVNFALKWTAHMESNEQLTFLSLNKGKNHQDYLTALEYYTAPAQNFVFAARNGDIAMKVQGRFPLKWPGQGKYLMKGDDPIYEWQGFIPFDHNPATLNPERGFVSSANQHPVDQSYPYYIFDNSYEHYRNRRLNQRLAEMDNITAEQMMELQFDQYHLHAAEALPVMLSLLETDSLPINDPKAIDYLRQLDNWNYNTFPNQQEATLFHIWWDKLYEQIWEKYKKPNLPIVLPNKFQTLQLLKEDPVHQVFDLDGTPEQEDAGLQVKAAFWKMVEEIKTWEEEKGDYSWASFKNTSVLHLVPNFKSFSRTGIYTGGGSGILNATSERHGASWRMVVEMGEKVTAFGIYPGGQSGNPGSRYYDNFLKKWSLGEYVDFSMRKPEDSEGVLFKTIFNK